LAKRWGEAAQALGCEGNLLSKQHPPKLGLIGVD